MSKGGKHIVFIYEGNRREVKYFRAVIQCFFRESEALILPLSAGVTVYDLYKKMKEHGSGGESYADVIGYLKEKGSDKVRHTLEGIDRDDIKGIYLFFDYDSQCIIGDPHTADDTLPELFETFGNETGNGKLYISYPQIEAFGDWVEGTCNTNSANEKTHCAFPLRDVKSYRNNYASSSDPHSHAGSYQKNEKLWDKLLDNFLMRIGCLFDWGEKPSYSLYKSNVRPVTIFDRQKGKHIGNREIFVLSAVPEFLLDYFKKSIWNKRVSADKKIVRGICTKQFREPENEG